MPPSNNYTPAKGEFLNSVVNKIGKQIWSSKAYVNPLKRLKKVSNIRSLDGIPIRKIINFLLDSRLEMICLDCPYKTQIKKSKEMKMFKAEHPHKNF